MGAVDRLCIHSLQVNEGQPGARRLADSHIPYMLTPCSWPWVTGVLITVSIVLQNVPPQDIVRHLKTQWRDGY